jgi:HK97 family phage major capsid protein/HK97 family phage prohead protease
MMNDLITRTVTLDRAAIDEESRTIPATLSTEYPVERFDGAEILDHSEDAVDLSRAPIPLIVSHDGGALPVGVVEEVRLFNKKLKGVLRFGSSAAAEEVWRDVKDGILQNLSVGYRILQKVVTGDTYRATKWELLECSIVAVPADPNARIGRSLNLNQMENKTMENTQHEISKIITELEPFATRAQLTEEETELVHRKMAEHDKLAAKTEKPVFFRDLGLKAGIREMTRTTNGNADDLPGLGGSDTGRIEVRGGPCGKDRSFRAMFGATSDRGNFKDANEFLTVLHSGRYDERLKRAMSTGTGEDGGFSVPIEFAAKWLDDSLESEIVRPRATIWPIEGGQRKVPGWAGKDRSGGITHGGFEMEWLAELGTGTRQSGKLETITLIPKKGAIFCQISNELAADGLGLEQQLESALVGSIGFGLDRAFCFGLGGGQPAGALSSANPALITVPKETGQIAGTITYSNLASMFARMAPSSIRRAEWVCNPTAIPSLLQLSIPVGTGGSFIPALKESDGKFFLLGLPCIFTEHCKSVGTAGDIALVDWSQYVIGLRKDVSLDKSNVPGWLTDATDYRTIVRVDGMGSWSAPITPLNGDTLSWAVTLAERS